MQPWIRVALVLLATYRIARLVTADYVTRPLRDWANRRDAAARPDADEPGALAYFVTCPWCVSMYAAIPVAFAAVWWPTNRAVLIALLVLAASAVAGIISTLLPED